MTAKEISRRLSDIYVAKNKDYGNSAHRTYVEFGEVALVPYDSVISKMGILFYETLFDENARCHLAFGEAYPECLEGGQEMTKEELRAHGLNDSMQHDDFMIGTADLCIVGTTHDGKEIPVFVNGNFAI